MLMLTNFFAYFLDYSRVVMPVTVEEVGYIFFARTLSCFDFFIDFSFYLLLVSSWSIVCCCRRIKK